MIVCKQTASGWLATHKTIGRIYAFAIDEEMARAKADAQLQHYQRAQLRVKLKGLIK